MQPFAIICMETVTVYGHHLTINCKVVVNSAATVEKFLMSYVMEVMSHMNTSKYNKLLISKRRIGILKNYLNKVKIMKVCDFIIFEILILTVWPATCMISMVKIGISNIIYSQTLTIFTLFW